jgi:uncharacterized SAM-binding protein YcdF (DUF218 family)
VAEFGWFLFSGGGAICSMAAMAFWVWLRPSSPFARSSLVAGAVCYALAGTPVVGSALIDRLGQGFAPLDRSMVPAGSAAVVVLGSGGSTVRGWDDAPLSVLDTWAAGRVLEAARLFRLLDPAWVIVSGGLADPDGHDEPTDVAMQRALVELGVPAGKIRVQTGSRNTHAEAVAIGPVLRSLGVRHAVLVTSRIHMRRATGTFRAEGLVVIPAPAPDRRRQLPWLMRLVPTDDGLSDTATAMHEIGGLVLYTLRGWYIEAA